MRERETLEQQTGKHSGQQRASTCQLGGLLLVDQAKRPRKVNRTDAHATSSFFWPLLFVPASVATMVLTRFVRRFGGSFLGCFCLIRFLGTASPQRRFCGGRTVASQRLRTRPRLHCSSYNCPQSADETNKVSPGRRPRRRRPVRSGRGNGRWKRGDGMGNPPGHAGVVCGAVQGFRTGVTRTTTH